MAITSSKITTHLEKLLKYGYLDEEPLHSNCVVEMSVDAVFFT